MQPADTTVKAEPDAAVTRFLDELGKSLADGSFVRVVLSGASTSDSGAPTRMLGRLIELRGEPHLSLTLQFPQRDETRNAPLSDARSAVQAALGSSFRNALLETTRRDWQLHLPADGPPRLKSHRPRCTQAPARSHDAARETWLDASANAWLQALGILRPNGQLRGSMADKHRQVHRYVEILSHLLDDCGWPPGQTVRVLDMGCGKGYLTFGVWHLLRRRGFQPQVSGIEARPGLVDDANRVARQLTLTGLEFQTGKIDSTPCAAADILIALHACNTATDDAIRRGIGLGARLILVAPCCHQELRPQLGHPEPLAPVLRHGLMQERMAEWLTDGLRAVFLEWAGYDTRLIEFVSAEHTARNVLLAAVRQRPPFTQPQLRQQVLDLKRFFSVTRHALDPLLDEPSAPTP